MKQYDTEVLIYLKKIKHFFNTNNDARKYFQIDINPDTFYEHLCDIAEYNLQNKGEPQLNRDQFEALKYDYYIKNTFVTDEYSTYSLN